MVYQSLIIEAYLEYKSNCWIGYDRRFRQQAASQPHHSWLTTDNTLWNLAFAGHAKTSRCKYCFSLSNQSFECDLSPELPSKSYPINQRRQIYFRWNEIPNPICSYPNCKYQHIYYICVQDLAVKDVAHKAIHYPRDNPVNLQSNLFPYTQKTVFFAGHKTHY